MKVCMNCENRTGCHEFVSGNGCKYFKKIKTCEDCINLGTFENRHGRSSFCLLQMNELFEGKICEKFKTK